MHYSPAETTVRLNHNPRRSVMVHTTTRTRKGCQPLPVVPGLAVELNLLSRKSRATRANSLGVIPKLKGLTAAQAGHQI